MFMAHRFALRWTRLAALCAVFALGLPGFAQTPPAPVEKINVVEKLPEKSPPFLPGYRIRWPLRLVGDPVQQKNASIVACLPTGGWLKPDASDLVVQTAAGQTIPVTVLSHDPAGDTIIQFKRNNNDLWYWAYGVSPQATAAKAEVFKEGLTVEVREWAGDDLDSWATVRVGLQKSENVIGNGLVVDVIQNSNPARPGDPRKFAASYRGYLDIKKAGTYRFLVNAEDASFLFIDGFKVYERPGANNKFTGAVPTLKVGKDLDLTAGVHPFEVHHVIGNKPNATGTCVLLWMPPEAKAWALVPREVYVQPMYAYPAAVEEATKAPAAAFHYGVDDSLKSNGVTLYLVRFEAQGAFKDSDALRWDFGDGVVAPARTVAQGGRSPTHVYFKAGTYRAKLISADGLPIFQRNVYVWDAPGTTSPFALPLAVRSLAEDDWTKADPKRANQMFEFLLLCEQPTRWPLLEKVAGHLLEQPDLDGKIKATLLTARIEALAEMGRTDDALHLGEKILPEFAKSPSLAVGLKMTIAQIYHRHLKDTAEASKRYKAILEEYRRLEHPGIRQAVIRWGDLFAEAGDLVRADETYKLASTLGGDKFKGSASSEAVTRGALLRIAEQRLRTGDIHQMRQLLEKIELEYPEQKMEGLYRFLRAEADRNGGRYEEALRNYEILLKLTQWAGYHDRAVYGIADSYYRMANPEKALEWLATLKESFPRYYEKQKLADYQKMVENRRDWRKTRKDRMDPKKTELTELFSTGFEPDEKESFGKPGIFPVVPSLGLRGPHVVLMDAYPAYKGFCDYARPLDGLEGDGDYWVEFWVRDVLAPAPPTNNPHCHVWIISAGLTPPVTAPMGTLYFERTLGRWRKLGYLIKAPPSSQGVLTMTVRHIFGVMEIDGLSIRPISARLHDSLVNFLEGAETP
jgi:tetratricopeptide (TPR) repeat protein